MDRRRNSISFSATDKVRAKGKSRRTEFSLSKDDEAEDAQNPYTRLFETLMNDPVKRAMVVDLITSEKEAIEEYKRKDRMKKFGTNFGSPADKLKRKYALESPTAMLKRKAMQIKESGNSSSSSGDRDTPTPTPSHLPVVPFEQVLKKVVAFVEVRSKNEDRSDGVKALLRNMGAVVKEQFTSDVTHVIFKDGSFLTYQKAKLTKKHLVSVLWLETVRTTGRRVPERNYPALGTNNYDNNVTLICEKLQNEYMDVVKDEMRKSMTSADTSSQKTLLGQQNQMALLSELNNIQSTSNSSVSNRSVSEDIIPSSQDLEVNSIISRRNKIKLSYGKSPNSLMLEDSDLESEWRSECGVVNGHSIRKKSATMRRQENDEESDDSEKLGPNEFTKTVQVRRKESNAVELNNALKKGAQLKSAQKRHTINKVSNETDVNEHTHLKLNRKSKASKDAEIDINQTNFKNTEFIPEQTISNQKNKSRRTLFRRSSEELAEDAINKIEPISNSAKQKSGRRTMVNNASTAELANSQHTIHTTRLNLKDNSSENIIGPSWEGNSLRKSESLKSMGTVASKDLNAINEIEQSSSNIAKQKSRRRTIFKAYTAELPSTLNKNNNRRTIHTSELSLKNDSSENIIGPSWEANGSKKRQSLESVSTTASEELGALVTRRKTRNMRATDNEGFKIPNESQHSSILTDDLSKSSADNSTEKMDGKKNRYTTSTEGQMSSLRISDGISSKKSVSSANLSPLVLSKNNSPLVSSKDNSQLQIRKSSFSPLKKLRNSNSISKLITTLDTSNDLMDITKNTNNSNSRDSVDIETNANKSSTSMEMAIINVNKISTDVEVCNRLDSSMEITRGAKGPNCIVEGKGRKSRNSRKSEEMIILNENFGVLNVNNSIEKSPVKQKTPKLRGSSKKRQLLKPHADDESPRKKMSDENSSPGIESTRKSGRLSRVPLKYIQTDKETTNGVTIRKNKKPPTKHVQQDTSSSDASPAEVSTSKPRVRKLYNPNSDISDSLQASIVAEVEKDELDKKTFKKPNPLPPHPVPRTPIPLTVHAKKMVESMSSSSPATSDDEAILLEMIKTTRKSPKKKTKSKQVKVDSSQDEQRSLLEELVGKKQQRTRKKRDDSLPIKQLNRRSTMDFMQGETATPKKNARGKLRRPTIVCTRFHRNDVAVFNQIVNKLGVYIVENDVSDRTTHLIVAEPSRTINILRAIARGIWVLRSSWLYASLESDRWLPEEDHELVGFSPAVQQCRIERQVFGPLYAMDVFQNCGPIYVARSTNPRCSDLEELIGLCKGTIVTAGRQAAICVGEQLRYENVKCVSVVWVLDSITFNQCRSMKKYLLEASKTRKSDHF